MSTPTNDAKALLDKIAYYDDVQVNLDAINRKISETQEIIAYIPTGVQTMRDTWVERLSASYYKIIKSNLITLFTKLYSLEDELSKLRIPYDELMDAINIHNEYEAALRDLRVLRTKTITPELNNLLAVKKRLSAHSAQMSEILDKAYGVTPECLVEYCISESKDITFYNNLDWEKIINEVKNATSLFQRRIFGQSEMKSIIEEAKRALDKYLLAIKKDEEIRCGFFNGKAQKLQHEFYNKTGHLRNLLKKQNERRKKEWDEFEKREKAQIRRQLINEGHRDDSFLDLSVDLKFGLGRYPELLHAYISDNVPYFDSFWEEYGSVDNLKEKISAKNSEITSVKTQIKEWLSYLTSDQKKIENCFIVRSIPTETTIVKGSIIYVDQSKYKKPPFEDIIKAFKDKVGTGPDSSVFGDIYRTPSSYGKFQSGLGEFMASLTADKQQLLSELNKRKEMLSADNSTKAKSLADLKEIQHRDPAAAGFDPKDISQVGCVKIIEAIQTAAAKRFSLPWIVNPFVSRKGYPAVPEMIEWQSDSRPANMNFIYQDNNQKKPALNCLNEVLLNILIAFKIKDVKITFIDTTTSNDGAFFTTRLGSQVCSVVNRDMDIRHLCEQWQAKASMVGKYTSDLLSYNVANKTMLTPYEIIVILGKQSNAIESQLEAFIENGYKYGLYFFNFSDQKMIQSKPQLFRDITYSGNARNESFAVGDPMKNQAFIDALFSYINTNAQKETHVKAISQDIGQLSEKPYGDAIEDFAVPVGEVNGHEIHFKLSNQHIHSFVIGQTGQGKSVFLHDVIAGSILNYSPEQFQIYLLDFKLAGEELYHYKDVKHVRALLANGSDLKVTFEVLNNLKNQMQERSNLMRESGARTLEEYNAEAQRKIPRILLVVDECQELFRDSAHRQAGDSSVMIDIRNIVEDIARKGRSQGVHLLFATQTLSGTQLPAVIKNNITDCFIFKCAHEDAEQLVTGSGKKIGQLKVGHLLYNSCDGETVFHSYLPDVDSMVDEAMRKSKDIVLEHNRFVFDGNNEMSMDKNVIDEIINDTRRNLRFTLGKGSDLNQKITGGQLKRDLGENILFVGYNHRQTVRASFNTILSMMISNKAGGFGYEFYCLDLLKSEDESIYKPLDYLSEYGLKILSQSQSGEMIADLANCIRNGVTKKCVLFILGQERFRAVRDEYEIPGQEANSNEAPRMFGRPQAKTYRSELRYILENGPESGIHTILQIDKLSNLLFENNISSRFVYRLFGYVCLLRCEKETEMRLSLDGLYPHQLSEEDSNLGAWFINDTNGTKEKFTPFVNITEDTVKNGLNL